jgi:hypothetical protein
MAYRIYDCDIRLVGTSYNVDGERSRPVEVHPDGSTELSSPSPHTPLPAPGPAAHCQNLTLHLNLNRRVSNSSSSLDDSMCSTVVVIVVEPDLGDKLFALPKKQRVARLATGRLATGWL